MKKNTTLALSILLLFSCKTPLKPEEITADNVYQLLDITYKPFELHEFNLTSFQPWAFYTLVSPIGREGDARTEVRKTNPTTDGRSAITLIDKSSGTMFEFNLKDNDITSLTVSDPRMDMSFDYDPIPFGSDFVDYLIKEKGFQYKKSNLKNGSDLLLQERKKNEFLACHLIVNDQGKPVNMILRVLTKK